MINYLRERFPDSFTFTVSHTTRPPRGYEEEGVHYYFITESKFKEMLIGGEFLEHTYCHNNFYGTSYKSIEESIATKRSLLLDLDLNGVISLKENERFLGRVLCILLKPKSKESLTERIVRRKSESVASFLTRSRSTDKQLLEFSMEENRKYFDFEIVNDVLDDTLEMIVKFLKDRKVITE